MTWEKFYDKIMGDVITDEDILRNMTRLNSFGSAEQVCDVAFEFTADENAGQFLRLAYEKGVRFSTEELIELDGSVDKDTLMFLIKNGPRKMCQDDFEALEFYMDDATRAEILAASSAVTAEEEEEPACESSREPEIAIVSTAEENVSALSTVPAGSEPSDDTDCHQTASQDTSLLVKQLRGLKELETAGMEEEKLIARLSEEKSLYISAAEKNRRKDDDEGDYLTPGVPELIDQKGNSKYRCGTIDLILNVISISAGLFLFVKGKVLVGLPILALAGFSIWYSRKKADALQQIDSEITRLGNNRKARNSQERELYNRAVEQTAQQYRADFDCHIAKLKALHGNTQDTLRQMYEAAGISEPFRGLVPVSMYYEYVKGGVCHTLDGGDGAIRLYMEQAAAGRIESKLDQLLSRMDNIDQNQKNLQKAIQLVNNNVNAIGAQIVSQMGGIQQQVADTAAMQQYYNERMANNMEWMNFMQTWDWIGRHSVIGGRGRP